MDSNKVRMMKDKFSLSAFIGLAVLSVVTIILIISTFAEPNGPIIDQPQHFYLEVLGACVGWVWMTTGLYPVAISSQDSDPIFSAAIFSVGLGLVLIFNAIFINSVFPSIFLQIIGYVVLVADAIGMSFYLHHFDHEQREEIYEA